jgi:hypothetical protein
VLPELEAIDRRTLALVELCGLERKATARDLGIEEGAVAEALAAARKALRRTRGELASGARCERAELLLSSAGLDRFERKWLEIHMARCSRCIAHEALLAEASAELHATFEAEPVALPPAPEPPVLPEPRADDRARLRVVPPAPEELEPELEPEPSVQDIAWPVDHHDGGDVSTRTEQHAVVMKPRPSPAARQAARVIAIILVIMGILAGIGIGLDALRGPDHATAPWTKPAAPNIRPAPLSGQ